MTINKVILVGHLGKDPDFRKLTNDVTVVTFPLATENLISKSGTMVEETEWHNIVLWRDLGDIAAKLLTKGKLIYLEGKIQTRSFERDGIKRYSTEIIGNYFQILGARASANTNNVQSIRRPEPEQLDHAS